MKRILSIICALISAVLVLSVFVYLWQCGSPGRSLAECKRNLKTVGLALRAYHDSNACFPAALSQSQPPHSWRVALLPWLDQQPLFDAYDQQTAWDHEPNRQLLTQRPNAYRCPEVTDPTHSSYRAFLGVQTAWPFTESSRMFDFIDGTSNTAMVLDLHDSTTAWTRPAEPEFENAMAAIQKGQKHSTAYSPQATNMLFADGSVRIVSQGIDSSVLQPILTPNGGRSLTESRATMQRSVRPSGSFGDPVDCATLPATKLWPTADVALTNGTTVVYCPTMALAWNEYIQQLPQVAFTDLGQQLQHSPFSKSDIDAASLQLEVTSDNGPRILCKLRKHLAFSAFFDSFYLPLTFRDHKGEHKVKSFGVTSHWTDWRFALAQIRVHDYRSPDDFVISIGNLNSEDLILAKMPQPQTLQDGMAEVTSRIRDSRVPPNAREVVAEEDFVVPTLELSLCADFKAELNHDDQPPGARLLKATQEVQFRLDERGAVVQSEAEVIGENGAYEYTPGTRTFIFDKPFLVMLRESPSRQPYFSAWIGNTDLMIPRPQK